MTNTNEIPEVIAIDTYDENGRRLAATVLSSAWNFRHQVFHIDEGDEGRQVYQGPMVPGPWAGAFGLCTVIDNHGGTGADNEAAKAAGLWLEVQDGDRVRVRGNVYIVRVSRRGEHLNLESA